MRGSARESVVRRLTAAERLRGEPTYVPGFGFRPALAGFHSAAAISAQGLSVTEHVLPFEFDSVEHYIRFNKAVLPPQMLQMVQERFGSDDAPRRLGCRRQGGPARRGCSWKGPTALHRPLCASRLIWRSTPFR